jgi:heme A synthase
LIPPLEPEVLIEYSHRLTAALTSILLVATVVVTIRRAAARGVRRVAIALLVLLGIQIGLGGITVLLRLPNLISTAHLVDALLILAGLLLLAARPDTGDASPAPSPRLARLIRAGLAVLLVQLALGGYVRHAGAGLGCADFPLCNGGFLPEHGLAAVHWVHRWLGVILLGLFVHIAIAARGTRFGGSAVIIAALAGLQVTLGIATVLLGLDPPIRVIHAMVGYALWGALVWVSARAGSWRVLLGNSPTVRGTVVEAAHAP